MTITMMAGVQIFQIYCKCDICEAWLAGLTLCLHAIKASLSAQVGAQQSMSPILVPWPEDSSQLRRSLLYTLYSSVLRMPPCRTPYLIWNGGDRHSHFTMEFVLLSVPKTNDHTGPCTPLKYWPYWSLHSVEVLTILVLALCWSIDHTSPCTLLKYNFHSMLLWEATLNADFASKNIFEYIL